MCFWCWLVQLHVERRREKIALVASCLSCLEAETVVGVGWWMKWIRATAGLGDELTIMKVSVGRVETYVQLC